MTDTTSRYVCQRSIRFVWVTSMTRDLVRNIHVRCTPRLPCRCKACLDVDTSGGAQ